MNPRPLKIGQHDRAKGHPFAPVQLIEYGDYECPYSRKGYRFAQLLLRKKEGQLYFAFRNFPLREKHPHAQLCAEAALAAANQDQFWPMHDLMFENNRNLNREAILKFANQIGINTEQLKQKLVKRTFREAVFSEIKEGLNHGVDDTPTFFINGNRYEGPLSYKGLKSEIELLL
ncbi:DsbA family protein [Fodinibius halophilus]|uniref:Thioredoxin domain-containing protein n=1 Tax=Fodinibius halophilus TaxID=1736908 RepID=A0A6M1TEU5_9BACT|nr:thioredoxin domain-containing protein [Fodinibius halophilus]NGP89274.1 thioredoxin domain-containing protein [Fodinibius halophilus]